jgi:hypothetical protein
MALSKKLIFFSIALLLEACSTQSLAPTSHRSGEWSAKAQVTEMSTGKSQQVSLDIYSVWPQKMRIEATAILGIEVAVLAVEGGHFNLILPREKKYYSGPNSEKALQNVFKVPLNPEWLINMTFDQDIKGPGWICGTENTAELDQEQDSVPARICRNAKYSLKVEWRERSGDRKRVVITNATHQLQLLYKSYSEWDSTKAQEGAEKGSFFKLSIPEGFTKYNIM